MKQDKIKLLIEDINEIEKKLSEKYGAHIELKFSVKAIKLDVINEAVEKAITLHNPKSNYSIKHKLKEANLVVFKHLFMYIARESQYSLQEIADYLGMNHATILFCCNKIKYLIEKNDEFTCSRYNTIKSYL